MEPTQHNGMADFLKYNRKKLGLTQYELAQKAGIGLRFIRELEQGKLSVRLDKVNQVLALFGHQAMPVNAKRIDPFEMAMHNVNKSVQILLKDKTELFGIILDSIRENGEIKAWRFVPNMYAIAYLKKPDPKLESILVHADIDNVKNL